MSLALLDELKTLGVEVVPKGDNLVIRPASQVPQELKDRLRAQKSQVLEALRNRRAIGSKEEREQRGKAIACSYDWQDGYRGLRLRCVAHAHSGGSTVLRMATGGQDVLQEMLELGLLTGRALEDARRVN